jgi:uroporphyrinogen-III synthase
MSASSGGRPLAGRGIVITRPAHQAEPLARMIRAAGGRAILFPVLEILDAEDLKPLNALIDRLEEFDLAIFISPNAVNKAMNLITARRILPATLSIAAIGRGSVKALAHFGVAGVITPGRRFDSEALLELPALADVAGRRVVIFRGEGGRELLGDTLTARGARIEYAECYRRARPAIDTAPLMKAWARGELHAVVLTSSEGLRNLFDMVGKLGQTWLRKTPLIVPHPRIAETARGLGLAHVVVTEAGDEGIVAGLCRQFSGAGRESG